LSKLLILGYGRRGGGTSLSDVNAKEQQIPPLGLKPSVGMTRLRVLKAGLPGFRFHDLRHCAITQLAEDGTSDSTIMAIAGHVSRRMLERYSHVRMEAKRKAMEALATSTKTAGYDTNHDTNPATASTRPV